MQLLLFFRHILLKDRTVKLWLKSNNCTFFLFFTNILAQLLVIVRHYFKWSNYSTLKTIQHRFNTCWKTLSGSLENSLIELMYIKMDFCGSVLYMFSSEGACVGARMFFTCTWHTVLCVFAFNISKFVKIFINSN